MLTDDSSRLFTNTAGPRRGAGNASSAALSHPKKLLVYVVFTINMYSDLLELRDLSDALDVLCGLDNGTSIKGIPIVS